MNKNIFTPFFAALTGFLCFCFTALLCAELPEINQERDLHQKYHEARTAKNQTMEAPLTTSGLKDEIATLQAVTLEGQTVSLEHSRGISIRDIGTRALHIAYEKLPDAASLSWKFGGPKDLRNRWFALRYSGAEVPKHVLINVTQTDNSKSAENFALYLEKSIEPSTVKFKFPDRPEFKNTASLSFVMDPSNPSRTANFVILDFEMLPPDQNPLAELAGTDANRFERYGMMVLPQK
jgi:hypothetical protein